MKIGISNLAWDLGQDEAVAEVLKEFNVYSIDIAPGKYFADIIKLNDDEIIRVRRWWADRGIPVTGMQSLLFGTKGLNIFGGRESQLQLLNYLKRVCHISALLGATKLVFGSPKNRDRGSMSEKEALEVAATFFKALGDIASEYGVLFCLEPNPPCYGANFMLTSEEAAAVVKAVNHKAVRLQFDTGASTISGEDPFTVLEKNADLIGHIHISEPNLVELGKGGTDHARMGSAIKSFFPHGLATIEMIGASADTNLQAIRNSLLLAQMYYC
ncbi:MAG: sugar phosphate isomerase/epimerase [Bdellovibrionaceae bacterium]|nr:sugar phosphate isomerase/epimerase [Pseudobdellovibrionaceae bacterium]